VAKNYPQYQLFDESLQSKLVGLTSEQVVELRKPEEKLSSLLGKNRSGGDKLLGALQEVIDIVTSHSKLRQRDFGVFGSILHGFHHPDFSDLDFIVYGRSNTGILRETLEGIYGSHDRQLVNEFNDGMKWAEGRHWYFTGLPLKEFCELSKRKMIYGIYSSEKARRSFKVEFEPVRDWDEINEKYDPDSRIKKIGWIKAVAEILDDSDSFFMPSIYLIEMKKLLSGSSLGPIDRIISFVEEFRGQVGVGEKALVEGSLEEVRDSKGKRYQITLTRTRDYYRQVLKSLPSSDIP
jgi:predicted nucleotidyltransferase